MHASFILAMLIIGTVVGVAVYATIASFCKYTRHDSAPHFTPKPIPPPLTPCEKFALDNVYDRCKSCEYGQRNDDLWCAWDLKRKRVNCKDYTKFGCVL